MTLVAGVFANALMKYSRKYLAVSLRAKFRKESQVMSCNCILIIEDERDAREALREILEIEGFNVATAENGQLGLELLQTTDEPCLILLDLMMPVMNGWEFLEALRHQQKHVLATIPVVVVSAIADLTAAQNKYNCDFMKKPVNVPSLVSLAHQYCKSSPSQ